MIRAVFDTNVLASAFAGEQQENRNAPSELLRLWRQQAFILIYSDYIVTELRRTLRNRYFAQFLEEGDEDSAINSLRVAGEEVALTEAVSGVASHREDDYILSTAVSGQAQYLVTGDVDLQRLRSFVDVTVVSPRTFLMILLESLAAPDSDDCGHSAQIRVRAPGTKSVTR